MLKVQEIRELIKLVDQSSIDEFVYENEGSKIKMKKSVTSVVTTVQPVVHTEVPAAQAVQAAPVQTAAPVTPVQEIKQEPVTEAPVQADTSNLHKITSPMVGTFYASPSPDADVYVKAGTKVSKDSIVCIVEAMKLFNEIEAEVNGEIVEVLAKDGQLVEYGQPLFLVKPE
ncbi:acetyl-CoA carboxylase biotin carboxyl carrier protein [Bacillus salipaludis]|uniref:Biotin carboxyl carrier protein of acetyl-CoA carboxylase n=1 Tax=Bacillus salipaludis TaxID=2547811 RepID=A0A4R5VNZ7_9BACI|nr:acetyl-CoA carboxylase biotin carboxyl carrier protein [Bacillus salipaludis]MDQ6599594.1 acetyl-CoA carboxylase biotin carboxyl carrier protein [Bacillus salipaludis]TDK60139.1 acetyl-CoA carboxylase biotin carboxyl carrier protein [Bacillus salipaludis]